jgi:hypothetical protein
MTPSRHVIESRAQKLHQSIVEMTMALKREHMTTPGSAAFDLACKEFREKDNYSTNLGTPTMQRDAVRYALR